MDFQNNPFTYLIILGIGLGILELVLGAATAFELLVIGIIFVIAGFLGMAANSFTISIISIITLSFIYFFAGRKMIRNTFDIETKATNIDAVMGETGVVLKDISPDQAGQVKVNGEIWRATSEDTLPENAKVVVTGVSGVTLSVSSKKNK